MLCVGSLTKMANKLKKALQDILKIQDAHSSGCGKFFSWPFKPELDEYGCNCGATDNVIYKIAAVALKSCADTEGDKK